MSAQESNEAIRSFESVCRCAIRISGKTQGRKGVTWQVMIASLIFSGICLKGFSILRLTPGSTFSHPVDGNQFWDLPSIGSLSRDLGEAYLTLQYMLEPILTDTEVILRKSIWQYHETFERLKMLRLAVPESAGIPKLKSELESRRSDIEQNQLFQTLPESLKARVLKGETARLLTNKELCARSGVSPEYFGSIFKYGSNHTHSSPLSFAQMDAFRASDPEAVEVFDLAIKASTSFVALAIRDFVKQFPDQAASLSDGERHLVRLWEEIVRWK